MSYRIGDAISARDGTVDFRFSRKRTSTRDTAKSPRGRIAQCSFPCRKVAAREYIILARDTNFWETTTVLLGELAARAARTKLPFLMRVFAVTYWNLMERIIRSNFATDPVGSIFAFSGRAACIPRLVISKKAGLVLQFPNQLFWKEASKSFVLRRCEQQLGFPLFKEVVSLGIEKKTFGVVRVVQ
mmetsp:Transcript_4687/g.9044  ORF Transcript_4687/g.9044 Transcript_4687/m.9044 type:complete len:186 (-) Transcript_4687:2147-2704(-)